jgi:UDP-N-acetylmuramoylalanine--D-glutamate ligase
MGSQQTATQVIVGLGQTGLSCVKYFHSQAKPCVVIDSRQAPPGLKQLQQDYPEVRCYLGDWHLEIMSQAEEIIVSPGIDLQLPVFKRLREQGVVIIGDIELFMRQVKAPVIGITGSNAKGTVTTCLADMLRAAGKRVLVGGNIGIPALDLLAEAVPEYYVLELSSFQLETIPSLALELGVILNISPDHLDRHVSMEAYIAAKQRIYQCSEKWVVNRDDVDAQPRFYSNRPCQSFGLDEPGAGEFGLRQQQDHYFLAHGAKDLLAVSQLRMLGRHNWSNALAALALGYSLDLPIAAMLQALQTFEGLPNRCRLVAEINKVKWFNDSKATNVGSCIAALTGLGPTIDGKLILLAGGQGKGADFSVLQSPVQQYVREAILFGEDAKKMAQALQTCTQLHFVDSLVHAVNLARELANPGDAVLLAPACASLDMFSNYAERGAMFEQLVRQLELV